MARTKKTKAAEPQQTTIDTNELAAAMSRIVELEMINKELADRVSDLEDELAEANSELEDDDDIDLSFLRDQLDNLAVWIDSPSAPQTPEQWTRCLQGLLRGEPVESGAWK